MADRERVRDAVEGTLRRAGLFWVVWPEVSDDGASIRLERDDGSVEVDSVASARAQIREWRGDLSERPLSHPITILAGRLAKLAEESLRDAIDRRGARERLEQWIEELPLEELGLFYVELACEGDEQLAEIGALVVRDRDERFWAVDLGTLEISSGEQYRERELFEDVAVPDAAWPHLIRGVDERDGAALLEGLQHNARELGWTKLAAALSRGSVRAALESFVEQRSSFSLRGLLQRAIPTVTCSGFDADDLAPLLEASAGLAIAYRKEARFEVGAMLRHAKLGLGVVLEASPSQIRVQFAGATKALVHAGA